MPTEELKTDLGTFGGVSCEDEVFGFDDRYGEYLFTQSPFNKEALNPDIYLIVGRKGSGKSSLGQYLYIRSYGTNAKCRFVWDSLEYKEFTKLYDKEFAPIVESAPRMKETINFRFAEIWETVIWSLLFEQYKDHDPYIKLAHQFPSLSTNVRASGGWILKLFSALLRSLIMKHDFAGQGNSKDQQGVAMPNKRLPDFIFKWARAAVLRHSQKTPIILALDTLEKYSLETASMNVLAAQVETASNFKKRYSKMGIQIKIFLASEVFLHVKNGGFLSNATKSLLGNDTLYLHWHPRSLLRLICWKFYKHLEKQGKLLDVSYGITEQSSYEEFLEKMWVPYFGRTIVNGHGIEEESFPYVLRHTQLRPRQLILLCNAIAQESERKGTFPIFSLDDVIKTTIQDKEEKLVGEVFNSYALVYPGVQKALGSAFHNSSILFKGEELKKAFFTFKEHWGKQSSKEWNLSEFISLVAELGIVGRAQIRDESPAIEAKFEYSIEGRLPLEGTDDCVIHPMFFHPFRINKTSEHLVYPFLPHDRFYEIPKW